MCGTTMNEPDNLGKTPCKSKWIADAYVCAEGAMHSSHVGACAVKLAAPQRAAACCYQPAQMPVRLAADVEVLSISDGAICQPGSAAQQAACSAFPGKV